jgi:hypothetical protein
MPENSHNNFSKDALLNLLTRHIQQRQDELVANQLRIVHYTSTAVGLSLIRNKEVWMRNTQCMNDYAEVEHGIQEIKRFFANREKSSSFWDFIENIRPGIRKEIGDYFEGWQSDLLSQTYICCLSEHSQLEDKHGRLSMWRAYGRGSGIAIVINSDVMLRESDALEAYSYPVFYWSENKAEDFFRDFCDEFTKYEEGLRACDNDEVLSMMMNFFQSFAFCLNHEGFHEEREWRVVYRPNWASSEYMKSELTAVNGVPQRIYKMPLKDIPDKKFYGVELNELIYKIIIGPCDHPLPIRDALVEALHDAKVENAHNRVTISHIPLRY